MYIFLHLFTVPLPPANFQVSGRGAERLVLSWDAPIQGEATRYSISYHAALTTEEVQLQEVDGLSQAFTGLTPLTEYVFTISSLLNTNSDEVYESENITITGSKHYYLIT